MKGRNDVDPNEDRGNVFLIMKPFRDRLSGPGWFWFSQDGMVSQIFPSYDKAIQAMMEDFIVWRPKPA